MSASWSWIRPPRPAALDLIPSGAYTIPAISCVGRTPRQLQEAHVPYEIGHIHF
jgi:NAD(P) transhydrogenase